MIFNSYRFLAFFVIVWAIFWLGRRSYRLQNAMLLVASYWFYAAWDASLLVLIVASTIVDFIAGQQIEQARTNRSVRVARAWLITSVATNLGILGYFKYAGFFVTQWAELMQAFGLSTSLPTLSILLPIGISFYTFQTLGYTIDVYRGRTPACRSVLTFALYVAFFPQLVAGPIERSSHFLPQLQRPRRLSKASVAVGLQFVLTGYFAKVVISDSVGPIVDEIFGHFGDGVSANDVATTLAGVLGFAVQIYADFAGYTLIARGISLWLGFRLVSNFRQPYLARNPSDFWRRWHRSLSLWLQRNVYIELGGNRHGPFRTACNLMLTMLLGGLWHGAAWNFIVWGFYHGILLLGFHLSRSRCPALPTFIAVPLMFSATLLGWIFFRIESLDQAAAVMRSCVQLPRDPATSWAYLSPILVAFGLLVGWDLVCQRRRTCLPILRQPPWIRWSAMAAMTIAIVTVNFRPQPFIYFQF